MGPLLRPLAGVGFRAGLTRRVDHGDVHLLQAAQLGNLVRQNFFPQHAGNLGAEPLLHVAVDGFADGIQYSFEDGACVPSPYELTRRFALEEAPGEVETDGRGRVPVFDHHVVEDNSSADGLDLYKLEVVGDLAPAAD